MTAIITAPQAKPQRITLYYREGSSDKVYQASIEPQGDLFLVTFAFGRRGSTLSTGTKTQAPVDLTPPPGLSSEVLRPLKLHGAAIGSLHPYQTVPSPESRRAPICAAASGPSKVTPPQSALPSVA